MACVWVWVCVRAAVWGACGEKVEISVDFDVRVAQALQGGACGAARLCGAVAGQDDD